jgi:type II secretory pathway component PulF
MSSPVDYETPPGGSPRRAGVFDMPTFLRSGLLVGLFVVMMLMVVPLFATTFDGFAVELPMATKMLLATSRATAGGWWVALLAIPPGLAFLVAQFGRTGRAYARIAIVIALGGLVLFVALGIFMPMLTLVEGMSSKR